MFLSTSVLHCRNHNNGATIVSNKGRICHSKYVRFHTPFYMSGIQQGYAVTNKVVNIDIISKCLRKGMGYVSASVNRFHNNV